MDNISPVLPKCCCALLTVLFVFSISGCQPPSASHPSGSSQPAYSSSNERQQSEPRRPSRSHSEDGNASFDYYLLNLSWSPEFCYSHPNAAECEQHRGFTLHGLWPQRMDGGYPEHCSDEPGPPDPNRFADIYPDAHLLEHEWQTHGTCSGLDPETFFEKARAATGKLRIPAQLTSLDHQISMAPAGIVSLFLESNPSLPRSSLALSCGNNFLTAVEVCLDKQLQPLSCGPIRSCRANSVRIPPVQP